jgi:hypothetical protein
MRQSVDSRRLVSRSSFVGVSDGWVWFGTFLLLPGDLIG